MIYLYIYLLTLLFKPDPGDILVGKMEVYMREDGSMYIESSYSTYFYMSDCDLLFHLYQRRHNVCSDMEMNQIMNVLDQFETDTILPVPRMY